MSGRRIIINEWKNYDDGSNECWTCCGRTINYEMKDQLLRNPHGCVNVSTDKNQQKLFNNFGDRNNHSFPRIKLNAQFHQN